LVLKRAEEKDVDLLFDWINDPIVREQSFSAEMITYKDHVQWFEKKKDDPYCYLYIAYIDHIAVGMIRFDIKDKISTISYLVDKMQRGRGVGTAIIQNGLEAFLSGSLFHGEIHAEVKMSNVASIKIFEKLDFLGEIKNENTIRFKKIIA
jgi:RimJ/RimL family protein N-acetyltransferase